MVRIAKHVAVVVFSGGHVPVTAVSFATDNTPKCTISRLKILLVVKSSTSLDSATNTTLHVAAENAESRTCYSLLPNDCNVPCRTT